MVVKILHQLWRKIVETLTLPTKVRSKPKLFVHLPWQQQNKKPLTLKLCWDKIDEEDLGDLSHFLEYIRLTAFNAERADAAHPQDSSG